MWNVYQSICYWVCICRADKEKQQFSIEIDGLVTQVDSANKAKVRRINAANITSYCKKSLAVLLVINKTLKDAYDGQIVSAVMLMYHAGACRSWGLRGSWPPENMQQGSEYMFWPPKRHILSFKIVVDNSASFTSWRMKNLCQKCKVKLIFRGAWNRLMSWPDWPWSLIFYDRSRPQDGWTNGLNWRNGEFCYCSMSSKLKWLQIDANGCCSGDAGVCGEQGGGTGRPAA